MTYPLFDGKRKIPVPNGHKKIKPLRLDKLRSPEHYISDENLTHAVNVAMLLGQPLLLTGEPGTGKTLLADRISWELGFDPPLKFETKSDSEARDLFFSYNSLARFHDAQIKKTDIREVDYITYNALGTAIIRSQSEQANPYKALLPSGFQFGRNQRSVVLIDEIDKAPRDFPNDILNEIENMYFRIPELGNRRIEADPAMRPIVIITSNQEKHLPDAFLRRCVFYHIQFPSPKMMKKIVELRLKDLIQCSNGFLSKALELFYVLREQEIGLKKRPSTAELLGWLIALRTASQAENPVKDDREMVKQVLGVLVKYDDDMEPALDAINRWYEQQPA